MIHLRLMILGVRRVADSGPLDLGSGLVLRWEGQLAMGWGEDTVGLAREIRIRGWEAPGLVGIRALVLGLRDGDRI